MKTILVVDNLGRLHLLNVDAIEAVSDYSEYRIISLNGLGVSTKETILELSRKIAEAERNEIIA
jgi:uncharacterized protein YlzI (FlbEa/FlbD family)